MRSKKLDLDGVAAKFEGWRRTKSHRQPIPAELLIAAVGLLDRYSVTAICRRFRLNQTRFNQARGLVGVPSEQRTWHQADGQRDLNRVPRTRPAAKAGPRVAGANLSGGAFVELPPLQQSPGGLMPPAGLGISRGAARYRLVLESATGTLSVVTRAPGHGLVDAMCRFVLGALEDGSRA